MAVSQSQLLLVDDDPLIIQIMSRLLSDFPNQGFAISGEAALAIANELTPDLISLDANFPGMTGVRRVRTAQIQSQSGARAGGLCTEP